MASAANSYFYRMKGGRGDASGDAPKVRDSEGRANSAYVSTNTPRHSRYDDDVDLAIFDVCTTEDTFRWDGCTAGVRRV
jgi:hypothetical protein